MKAKTLIASILFIATINSSAAAPDNCESYPDKIHQLQTLNAKGGTAKQQAQRRKKIGDYEMAFYKCRNIKRIEVVSGETKNRPSQRRKLRVSNNPNSRQSPQLQQLIKTCNYWVEQTNNNPSWHNSNFRDTACRAADESQKAMHNPSPKTAPAVRKLSDCIKPNNVIDDDVNQCIKGDRAASWKNP